MCSISCAHGGGRRASKSERRELASATHGMLACTGRYGSCMRVVAWRGWVGWRGMCSASCTHGGERRASKSKRRELASAKYRGAQQCLCALLCGESPSVMFHKTWLMWTSWDHVISFIFIINRSFILTGHLIHTCTQFDND